MIQQVIAVLHLAREKIAVNKEDVGWILRLVNVTNGLSRLHVLICASWLSIKLRSMMNMSFLTSHWYSSNTLGSFDSKLPIALSELSSSLVWWTWFLFGSWISNHTKLLKQSHGHYPRGQSKGDQGSSSSNSWYDKPEEWMHYIWWGMETLWKD